MLIGRASDCDLVLSDEAVSRRHARVSVRNGALVVSDLGSTNGTYVGSRFLRNDESEVRGVAVLRVGGFEIEIVLPQIEAPTVLLAAEASEEAAALIPPEGRVTLLFSDIVGSSEATARLGDGEWVRLLNEHNALVRREVAAHHGFEVKTMGDAFMVAFRDPAEAVACALAIQAALSERNKTADEPIRIRVGLHSGEARRAGTDFFGTEVNRAARIAAHAQAGVVLISSELRDLVDDDSLVFTPQPPVVFKGFTEPDRTFEVSRRSLAN